MARVYGTMLKHHLMNDIRIKEDSTYRLVFNGNIEMLVSGRTVNEIVFKDATIDCLELYLEDDPKYQLGKKNGCGKPLAKGQWWTFCGETDMGQTAPALCEECDPVNGYKLKDK